MLLKKKNIFNNQIIKLYSFPNLIMFYNLQKQVHELTYLSYSLFIYKTVRSSITCQFQKGQANTLRILQID